MTFNVALSGIRSASDELDVIGNNVANASTTGFKASRAEFADVYAASVLGTSANAVGSGVQLAGVSQQFVQGNISFTGNNLDVAISGRGFFRLSEGGAITYTRGGSFTLDQEGYLVNNQGLRLTGFPADTSGNIQGTLGELQLNSANLSPTATSAVDVTLNLDSTSTVPTVGVFSASDADSYNDSSSTTIFDSLGNSHVLSQYFIKTGANAWDVVVQVDGRDVGNPGVARFSLAFNDDGSFDAGNSDAISITNWDPLDSTGAQNGAQTPESFTIDVSSSTQFSSDFAIQSLNQDGLTTGRLSNVSIESDGVIRARYTNGQTRALGQVAVADFSNPNGLEPQGNTSWAETVNSGPPLNGAPGTGRLGVVQSGALEDSTVVLTEELVGLIVAQRNFQANAQTIRTADAVTQTIINLR